LQEQKLTEFAQALEDCIQEKGELVLSSLRWDLDSTVQSMDLQDPFLGMTDPFKQIVSDICSSQQEWLQFYIALLTELATEGGAIRKRLVEASANLWMQTYYGSLCIWHKAFPPLDGGGSSQAIAFHRLFQDHFAGRRFRTCFEWCCGPGFLGLTALTSGLCEELILADINPEIVPGLERTIRENALQGKVQYYVSDNLKQIPKDLRFDLVLGNPPWAFREIPGLPNPLIPNDPHWSIHRAFLSHVKEHLNPEAVVVVSTYEPYKTIAYIEQQTEPWDIRPRPPIEDFRRFMEEGGLKLIDVLKPEWDSHIAMVNGMTFLIAGLADSRGRSVSQLDLIGLGGLRDEGEVPQRYSLDLGLFKSLDLPQCLRASQQIQALKFGIYSHFESKHLTQVLRETFGAPTEVKRDVLDFLGLPPQIVAAFPDWADPDRFTYHTAEPGFKLLAETPQQRPTKVRLQLTQDAPVCVGLRLLRDLLQILGEDSPEFLVTVKPGFSESAVREVLSSYAGYRAEKLAFWEHGHQTLFAQDNGRFGFKDDGSPALLTPGHLSLHRPADVLQVGPIPLIESCLHWEGGNLLCDGHRVFVGANSIASSMRGLGLKSSQVVEIFQREMGYPVSVLGSVEQALAKTCRGERGLVTEHAVDGGQADFHIDLDCCLLGASQEGPPRVMLCDPELGLNYVSDVMGKKKLFEGHFLAPSQARDLFRRSLDSSIARRADLLESYRVTFQEAGYEVLRVPDIRVVSDFNYLARVNLSFGYCNAFPIKIGERPTVCLLPFGWERLEVEVEHAYASAGVQVLWVGEPESSHEIAGMRGGLHCFCAPHG
jgi:Methyltransferase small domain